MPPEEVKEEPLIYDPNRIKVPGSNLVVYLDERSKASDMIFAPEERITNEVITLEGAIRF
jgi:hypothetical protein